MAARSRRVGPRPLWTCPDCGNEFVNRNNWHSCGRWPLATHFEGKPRARALFDRLREELERFGPVTVVSSKTRITFMTRVRFANVLVRRSYLRCGLWFTKRVDDPRFVKIERYSPRAWGHEFILRDESELTPALRHHLGEAYAIGQHDHLRRRI